MSYKIKKSRALKKYNKKYGEKNLAKISKIDVDKNPSLLDNKEWWLIDDTYFEVPQTKGFVSWWTSLGKGI